MPERGDSLRDSFELFASAVPQLFQAVSVGQTAASPDRRGGAEMLDRTST